MEKILFTENFTSPSMGQCTFGRITMQFYGSRKNKLTSSANIVVRFGRLVIRIFNAPTAESLATYQHILPAIASSLQYFNSLLLGQEKHIRVSSDCRTLDDLSRMWKFRLSSKNRRSFLKRILIQNLITPLPLYLKMPYSPNARDIQVAVIEHLAHFILSLAKLDDALTTKSLKSTESKTQIN